MTYVYGNVNPVGNVKSMGVMNVLSLSMIESLRKVMVDNPSLRCVVISSNGPVFSSGHDLKELVCLPMF
ncbi:unnamed protein product, partial [Medioppia subpectinata]